MLKNIYTSSLIVISASSIFGAIVYRFYALNWLGIIITLALAISASYYFIIRFFHKKNNSEETKLALHRQLKNGYIILFFYLIFFIAALYFLFSATTESSIISPWEKINKLFFVDFFLLTVVAYYSAIRNSKFFLLISSLHYFLSFSVVLIVYKIGFGFDPFIHQATERLIDITGSVNPKPLYYLGQYALVLIIHKLFFIPIDLIDKFLLIILTTIFLPCSLFSLCKKFVQEDSSAKLVTFLLLILPYPFLINTTPQSLAYFFLILAITNSFNDDKKQRTVLTSLFSLAAFSYQPIAGIPAIIFTIITFFNDASITNTGKKTINFIGFFALSLVLPASFYSIDKASEFKLSAKNLLNLINNLKFTLPNDENIFLNITYFFINNFTLIIVSFVIITLYLTIKQKQKNSLPLLLSASGTFLAYIFTSLLPFGFLISYERDNYLERLLIVTILFLLPFIIKVFTLFIKNLNRQEKLITIIVAASLAGLSTISLYVSYPRLDNYYNSHGLSTGINDLAAVKWINQDAKDANYIVLANQQVSAAALKEYGFSRYYKNDIFYYPIPTGGTLYQYYLEMVNNKPTRKTMKRAMDYAGVNTSYFVLNKYWWAFSKIKEEAKISADEFKEINDGQIIIYKFFNP